MVNVPMKETKSIVVVDDLDFGINDVAFETKVFNKCDTFDRIANKNMDDSGYVHLHCDLFDMATLTTITLRVKSPYINMHEQYLQKGMFMKVEIFAIESKSKRGFKKGDMHIVITMNSITIMSSIFSFQRELIPMFFHTDSIKKFRNLIQS
jgi:hypothetical protein